MVMDREAVADAPTLSITLTVKAGGVPVVDGVPETRPVTGFMLKPAGKVPDKMDHVKGTVPPLVEICRE
jgi:hypothetical protein